VVSAYHPPFFLLLKPVDRSSRWPTLWVGAPERVTDSFGKFWSDCFLYALCDLRLHYFCLLSRSKIPESHSVSLLRSLSGRFFGLFLSQRCFPFSISGHVSAVGEHSLSLATIFSRTAAPPSPATMREEDTFLDIFKQGRPHRTYQRASFLEKVFLFLSRRYCLSPP